MANEQIDQAGPLQEPPRSGPLAGVRVVELAGIGPGPHCAMLLSDLGAEVLRIEREDGGAWPGNPILERGRAVLPLDIRTDAGRERCLTATDHADVLIEGFRPGVMERRGLGPAVVRARNPRLIYARMTGWGQQGPLAQAAGHDINYIALTGALAAVGPAAGPPVPPLNLAGDLGGGSLFLALGIVAALLERERSGQGQVVDAAIVDGVSHMLAACTGMLSSGLMSLQRGASLLGGAAPFYRCYTCADGRDIAVGALEPQFYKELLDRIGAPADQYDEQYARSRWAARSEQLAALFATRDRDTWCRLLEGTDACFAPVLTAEEAPFHPHMVARQTHVPGDGTPQPAPAPRFSRTPGSIAPSSPGAALLSRWVSGTR
jgi:alpha-methylacyl-CoA racemase